MKTIKLLLALVLMLASVQAQAYKYAYDTVPGDPMKVKMYTLPNGLQLYMSVNKDVPRINTNIAVRVGGKNDPAETTGLAHYFEHLMFKGTPEFGTSNYAAEKPMLDRIEELFEVYRVTTDSLERARIYHEIDSISYEASKLAIPNEYDKLMSAIGSTGTNAYTSYDNTSYVETIPSNQLDNWARIQSLRFKQPVIRGFHTELETIYEEKNMSLTKDPRKVYERLFAMLYPHHPYGQQTILGSQEHLKNPSITNVKNYHAKWYVPNNMAIVMSGDFDPDEAVDVITKYFGDMQPNPDLQPLAFEPEAPITEPLVSEVFGPDAENVTLAWRFPGRADRAVEILNVVDYLLSNGEAGLLDLDIKQKGKLQSASSGLYDLADYTSFLLSGSPKEGQTLDEVRDMLLAEVKKLRDGDFDEQLLASIITNFKKYEQSALESNNSRVSAMVSSFVDGQPWADVVTSIDRQAALTKQDIVDFANRYLGPDNYAIVYKRKGVDPNIVKMPKPQLTPVETNRDMASDFLLEIQRSTVPPIEPRFVDYANDLTFLTAKSGLPVLYKHNDTNQLFSLTYVFETGNYADRYMGLGAAYLDYLGTPDMTAEQIKRRFFELGCSYDVSIGGRRSYITLSGLSENMPEAMKLMEHVLANAQPDEQALQSLVNRQLKSRSNAKGNQQSNFSALRTYASTPDYVSYKLNNDEIAAVTSQQLLDAVKQLRNFEHRIIYYGPLTEKELLGNIKKCHYTPKKWAALPEVRLFPPKETPETVFYLAPYDSNQLYMYMLSNDGQHFDMTMEPVRTLYNNYFGGDMSSIVFQEMRESRSLAYSASAGYSGVSYLDQPYQYYTYIATQNDKMIDAIDAFLDIVNNMPVSEQAFALSKDGLDKSLRSSRTIKDNVAWSYINASDLGYSISPAQQMYEALPGLTLEDVKAFQQDRVKGRTYIYAILGRLEDLDIEALQRRGKVVILTPEQIFGY